MKKFIFFSTFSLLALTWLAPIMAQNFESFLIDWSRYMSPYSHESIDFEDLPEGTPLSIKFNEPLLVAEKSEEYMWVKITAYSDSDLERPLTLKERIMFADEQKLKYLDKIKKHASVKLNQMRGYFDKKDQFNNIAIVDMSLNILREQRIDVYMGESDFTQKSVVDSFKCVINSDRYFFAIVNFIDERILIKSLGVCQRFFVDYWNGDLNNQKYINESVNHFIAFLMNISGKNRQEAQEIIKEIQPLF